MEDKIISIKKGAHVSSIAYQLKEDGLISNAQFFKYLAILKNVKIVAGKYKIQKILTSYEILKKLSGGEVLKIKVTIPEGYNLFEIARVLETHKITSSDDFLSYTFNEDFLQSIGIFSQSAEGYIFPDTYIFSEGLGAKEVILNMHNQMIKTLDSINLSNLNQFNLNRNQLLILSSIVEKEAHLASERKLISSVFHNRLRRGMRLDSDPTIRYAVKKFKGRIRTADLNYDSPFNTRKYKGLTPTPICSPGRDSILASLNPDNTEFFYFVARNDGSHYFSKTLKEHNKAVEYYQKGIDNGFVDKQLFKPN